VSNWSIVTRAHVPRQVEREGGLTEQHKVALAAQQHRLDQEVRALRLAHGTQMKIAQQECGELAGVEAEQRERLSAFEQQLRSTEVVLTHLSFASKAATLDLDGELSFAATISTPVAGLAPGADCMLTVDQVAVALSDDLGCQLSTWAYTELESWHYSAADSKLVLVLVAPGDQEEETVAFRLAEGEGVAVAELIQSNAIAIASAQTETCDLEVTGPGPRSPHL
jgi:hypothetical protein